jgi:hypothetical protein
MEEIIPLWKDKGITPLILINYNDVMFVKDIDVVAREATQQKIQLKHKAPLTKQANTKVLTKHLIKLIT